MPKPGEALWLDDDQDKVAAYLRLERELCPRCGTAEQDWVDPRTHRYLDAPKWEAEKLRCFGCAELEHAQADVPAKEKGVRVVLVPFREDVEADDDEGAADSGMLV